MSPTPQQPPTSPSIMGQGCGSSGSSSSSGDQEAEARINLALLEPQRWGWTAVGGIADLLPPHERARRQSSKTAFLKSRRKRDRSECATTTTTTGNTCPLTLEAATSASTSAASAGSAVAPWNGVNGNSKSDDRTSVAPPVKRAATENTAATAVVTTAAVTAKRSEENAQSTTTNDDLLLCVVNQSAASLDHAKAAANREMDESTTALIATLNHEGSSSHATGVRSSSRNSNASPPKQQQQQQQPQQSRVVKNTTSHCAKSSGGSGGVYDFRALQEDGTTLDIYTYHRGREGMELRDAETGNLLCDVPEPTDTNNLHVGCNYNSNSITNGNEGPKLVATVTIRIPIGHGHHHDYDDDVDNDSSGITGVAQPDDRHESHDDNNNSTYYFWETLKWDLADADTASPMTVAAQLAENFGLSFAETLQVAESIQQQLRAFCAEHASYTVPLSYLDPSTERKRDVGSSSSNNTYHNPAVLTELYGQIIGHAEGGLERCKSKERPFLSRIAAAAAAPPDELPLQRAERDNNNGISNNSNSSRGKSFGGGGGGCGKGHNNATGKAPPKRSATTSAKMAAGKKSQRAATTATKATCRGEVQKRLCLASAQAIRQGNNNNNSTGCGQITMTQNLQCHICCQVQRRVGIFACGIETHAFCVNHIEELLGLSTASFHQDNGGVATTVMQEESLLWDHCPICSLACQCEICVPKMEGLTLEFHSRCMAQQCCPEMTEFTELFEYSKTYQPPDNFNTTVMTAMVTATADVASKKAARKPNQTRARRQPERIKVAKLSVLQFPREVSNGIDFDPGTPLDYSATYSATGRHLPNEGLEASPLPFPLPFAGSSNSDVEDGSTDYCLICMGPGDLLCCDYCPRAFHAACIDQTNADEKSDDPWRCPRCCLENEGLPEDKLDGSKSLSLICAAYESFGNKVSSQDADMLRLLSIIHEMLLRLMEYDFGYTFREPVDISRCPGYSETVKRPMDLGTIATNLINAEYHNKAKVQSLEDIVIDVLKDIELVWQNCFSYNFEASAVYRMAEVQRRRAQATRRESFDDLLTDRIKRELAEYELSRVPSSRRSSIASADNVASSIGPTSAPASSKSRNKILVSHKRGFLQARVVGILDPDTRRVVKMYSTVASAASAVKFLLQLEHPCEWPAMPTDMGQKVRNFIRQSAKDPTLLLFGHRWLHMEELINGKVKFPKQQQQQDHPQEQQQQQQQQPQHRQPQSQQQQQSQHQPPPETTVPTSTSLDTGMDDEVQLAQFQASNTNLFLSATSENLPNMAVVTKSDLILGKRVASFRSIDAALEDWRQTCRQSSLGDCQAIRTMEVFRSQYLEGNRNIDGIVWKSVKATRSMKDDMMDTEPTKDSLQSESSTATADSQQDTNMEASPDLSPEPAEHPTHNNIPESQNEDVGSPSFTNTSSLHAAAVTSDHRKEALFDVSLRMGALQNGTTKNPMIRENKRAKHDDPVTA